MNLQLKTIASLLCICALPYANAGDFEDHARVISVKQQFEQVNNPKQDCRTEYVPVEHRGRQDRYQERSAGGSILGGVAGAIIGNQVGGGNGRVAATAAGAIAGAIVGDRLDNNGGARDSDYPPPQRERAVRQCHTVDHWESRPNGYAVSYEYRGHTYTSVMPYDPGEHVKLHVTVVPYN